MDVALAERQRMSANTFCLLGNVQFCPTKMSPYNFLTVLLITEILHIIQLGSNMVFGTDTSDNAAHKT